MFREAGDHYCESKVRTNKLWCSDCERSIKKGETAVFKLVDSHMVDVFCPNCGEAYSQEVVEDTQHPFDLDG